MIPNWSDKHPNKRAQKIYLVAYWSCAALWFTVFCAVYIAALLLMKFLGVRPSEDVIPLLGLPYVLFYSKALPTAKARGLRALERDGWIREQTETIARTATNFAGQTLEFSSCTIVFRLFGAGFFLLLAAGCCWFSLHYFRNSFYALAGIPCAMLFAVSGLQALFLVSRPELRLDERGVTINCQGVMSSRLVPWQAITCLERKRVWGLPPNYEPTTRASETVSLHDATGKTLLILSAGAEVDDLSAAMGTVWTDNANSLAAKNTAPTQIQLFIAEIERRLTAATASVLEENFDE